MQFTAPFFLTKDNVGLARQHSSVWNYLVGADFTRIKL